MFSGIIGSSVAKVSELASEKVIEVGVEKLEEFVNENSEEIIDTVVQGSVASASDSVSKASNMQSDLTDFLAM